MSISEVLMPIHFVDTIKNRNNLIESDQTLKTYMNHINKRKPSASSLSSLSPLEHVLILDFDDTLIPTSYLLSNIHYNINKKTKKIKQFSMNSKLNQSQIKQFLSNLDKAGQSSFKLLQKIFAKFKASNVKIVTNGVKGWIPDSLFVAATFCPIYNNIQQLLNQHKIEIIYARDHNLEQIHWKTKCFDQILWQFFSHQQQRNVNVVTIGDQWLDHESIKSSLTHLVYGHFITHHQIKFLPNPDCRYLCVELNYIATLLDMQILFTFSNLINGKPQKHEGLVLEFDGYNNDNDNDK